ncbi:MAG: hypothetical protein ACI8RZ_007379, partial [Myxococcota bacterium]
QERFPTPSIPIGGTGSRWVQHLKASDAITPALFSDLMLAFPERVQDILLIARQWSVSVSPRSSRRFL